MVSADSANVTYSVFKWVPSSTDSEDVYKIRTFLRPSKVKRDFPITSSRPLLILEVNSIQDGDFILSLPRRFPD